MKLMSTSVNLDEGSAVVGLATPLYYVCMHGDESKLQWLLSHGVDINQRAITRPSPSSSSSSSKQTINETPLITAIAHRNPRLARILIEEGAMVNPICQTKFLEHPSSSSSSTSFSHLTSGRTEDFEGCSPLLIALKTLGFNDISSFEATSSPSFSSSSSSSSSTTSTIGTTSTSTMIHPHKWKEDMEDVARLLIEAGGEVIQRSQ
jgi:hypothetical protein